MLEIYTQKTLETGNFVIETRRHSLSSWCPYVKASMRRISASGRAVLRDGAASAGRSRPEAEPVPRVPGTSRVGDRGDAERGFGPGRRHRLPAGILVSPARRTFRGHGRVLPGGDRPAPWNGEPPGRHGRRGAFAGGISGCAQSGLSIQGISSLGSARETGLFAIDGPRKERPGDAADRKRATSTRTLGRFSAQGAPEGKGGAKLRSCFQVHGAWPAPRGVRSVVSAARYAGFPGPAYLTPHYLADPVGNYNNIPQSPRNLVFRGTNTSGRSKKHRTNGRGRRRRFRQTARPLNRPQIPCREWPRPWPPGAWR